MKVTVIAMMLSNNKDDKIQELINLFERYPYKFEHLKVFLRRRRDANSRPDNFFLMVTPRVFGKVEVLDLTVEDNFIIIEFLDCAIQEVGIVRLNIVDDMPNTLFIRWQDVKKMVLDEPLASSNEELLDFEF